MRRGQFRKEIKDEFETKVLDIARVTKVHKGGKHLRFRACVIAGDGKGRVGVGIAKGRDVAMAVEKATRQAKKHIIFVKIINDTIPHEMRAKFSAAKIILKPAAKGHGLIAGGPVRAVLELCGIKNIVSKMLKSENKISNACATIKALKLLKM